MKLFSGITLQVHPDNAAATDAAAALIGAAVRQKPDLVLGLATGRTPIDVYRRLIGMHRSEDLTFAGVRSFNLDEYFNIAPDNPASYDYYMRRQLFDHIDMPADNWHIPVGNANLDEIGAHCDDYEAAITAVGGIDLQLLGIGRNGHIGFNEPGSPRDSRTRLVELQDETVDDNSFAFEQIEDRKRFAVTMGLGTILEARCCLMVVTGGEKANALAACFDPAGPSSSCPASFLQHHPDSIIIATEDAVNQIDTDIRKTHA
jgi:glucosamine-6-phosphate deaminase